MKKRFLSMVIACCLVLAMGGCSTESPDAMDSSTEQGESETSETVDEGTAQEQENASETTAVGSGEQFDQYVYPNIQAEGGLKVGCLHPLANYPSVYRSLAQIQLECARYGWEYVDGLYETTDQTRDVWEALINAGCDVIFLEGVDDPSSYDDLIAKSREAGIGLYATETEMVDGIICNAMVAGATASAEMFYFLAGQTGFNANVAIPYAAGSQAHCERSSVWYGLLEQGVFNGMTLLAYEDMGGPNESMENCYNTVLAWLQQYGDELDIIYASSDSFGQMAAEAVISAGYEGEIITAGIDGDSSSFAALTAGGPFQATYMVPCELLAHSVAEVIYQIQVQGIAPGESGSSISESGETIYKTGGIVTASNLPEAGEPIHACFEYYDAEDTDAWYNQEIPEGIMYWNEDVMYISY